MLVLPLILVNLLFGLSWSFQGSLDLANRRNPTFRITETRPFSASFFVTSLQSTSTKTRDPGLDLTSVVSNPREVPGPTESIPSRAQQLRNLQSDGRYDVLVVGGGATGAGVALDAAARGLSVACIERGDFSSETSSRSTKLIWAGLKYMAAAIATLLSPQIFTHPVDTLQEFVEEMNMVLHCHEERRYMLESQPHLVYWLPILVPFDRWWVDPAPLGHPAFALFPLLAPLVFKFYDALSSFSCPPSYILSKEQALKVFPQLNGENLKYCSVFYEGYHNDARTNLAIAMSAAEQGADICNYVEMVDVIRDNRGKAIGVVAVDRMTGDSFSVHAEKIVLAAGPFTEQLLGPSSACDERKTKLRVKAAWGTHIVVPGDVIPKHMGLLDYNTSDGRFLFVAPFQGHTLIGTTDKKGPAETRNRPPEEDIEWLLVEASKYLQRDLTRSEVTSAWRGWRPLVSTAAGEAAPEHVSRDHAISECEDSGVFIIAGGKWTTWREMAQDVTDRVVESRNAERLDCRTRDLVLYGGGEGFSKSLAEDLRQAFGLDEDIALHLAGTYGVHAWDVCKLLDTTNNRKRLVEGFPYLQVEVVHACREYACTIEDILSRRTRLAFLNKDVSLSIVPLVADLMSKELGWSPQVQQQQMEAAFAYIGCYGGREPCPAGHDDEICEIA